MTNRKTVLLFLLVLCIGVLPLQNLNAGNVDHMQEMSLDCTGCDRDTGVDHDSCDGARCILSTGFCGAQSITSFLPKLLPAPMPRHTLTGSWRSSNSHYRSYLDFSIYRPPIT